ncbi:hypothetical protein DFQ26_002092 [Actinomortierella ambigua]|nr:hypothetical protein DFQ26_002092 [Actinomortierella ambigua]
MVIASKPDNRRLQQNLAAMVDLEDDDDDLETYQVGSPSSQGCPVMDTTNRNKGKSKGKNANTATEQDIIWMEQSSDKTPEAFFDMFGILSREEGNLRYSRALHRCTLSEQERTLLKGNFERWRRSESVIYWERRSTKAIAKKSAWKTAGSMIRGSEPFVETIISENAEEQRQHSAVPSDAPRVFNTPHQTSDISSPFLSAESANKGHAKRTRTTGTKALPTKRLRLQDPWHELADVALRLYNGNAVDLPLEETKVTELDPERQKLYGLAWRHLRDAKKASGQQNIDKENCLHFRDAFAALSGVFNMYSPVARKALTSAERMDAKGLCLLPELQHKDEELTKLLDSLKTSKTRNLDAVLEDVYAWLSSKPTYRIFLLVLRTM